MAGNTMATFIDQDHNRMQIHAVMDGMIIIDVTDENEIPVGMLADRALAAEIGTALLAWAQGGTH